MRKHPPYGAKRNYRKIDIYVGAYGKWTYRCSTTWARTCREAKEKFIEANPNICVGNIKTCFSQQN